MEFPQIGRLHHPREGQARGRGRDGERVVDIIRDAGDAEPRWSDPSRAASSAGTATSTTLTSTAA